MTGQGCLSGLRDVMFCGRDFDSLKADPGSEAAVRRMIGELQAGKPNYDLMSAGLADATRQQLAGRWEFCSQ